MVVFPPLSRTLQIDGLTVNGNGDLKRCRLDGWPKQHLIGIQNHKLINKFMATRVRFPDFLGTDSIIYRWD